MVQLKNTYPSVLGDTAASYGGNQSWAESKSIQRCGCGLVAAADLLLYLHARHPELGGLREISRSYPIKREDYERLLRRLERFMPLLPPFGMNGLTLTAGLEAYFLRYKLPYRIRWGVPSKKLFEKTEEMLRRDIPVILAIGPNMPILWGKERVKFYAHTPMGYVPHSSAKSHYVTVTGIDDKYLHISSWGRSYYIDRAEYVEYAKKHSSWIVTNIALVTEKT